MTTSPTQYSYETTKALVDDIRFLLDRASETRQAQTGLFENDEARVRIVARPEGTFSLQHNYGMLMHTFARIMAEEEANS